MNTSRASGEGFSGNLPPDGGYSFQMGADVNGQRVFMPSISSDDSSSPVVKHRGSDEAVGLAVKMAEPGHLKVFGSDTPRVVGGGLGISMNIDKTPKNEIANYMFPAFVPEKGIPGPREWQASRVRWMDGTVDNEHKPVTAALLSEQTNTESDKVGVATMPSIPFDFCRSGDEESSEEVNYTAVFSGDKEELPSALRSTARKFEDLLLFENPPEGDLRFIDMLNSLKLYETNNPDLYGEGYFIYRTNAKKGFPHNNSDPMRNLCSSL